MQPGEGALDDPAPAAEPRAVLRLFAGDPVRDAPFVKQAAVLAVVIATVGHQQIGPLAASSGAAADWRDAVPQRKELGDVVAVSGRRTPGQRQAAGVDDQVVLGPEVPTIDRARARRGAP